MSEKFNRQERIKFLKYGVKIFIIRALYFDDYIFSAETILKCKE